MGELKYMGRYSIATMVGFIIMIIGFARVFGLFFAYTLVSLIWAYKRGTVGESLCMAAI